MTAFEPNQGDGTIVCQGTAQGVMTKRLETPSNGCRVRTLVKIATEEHPDSNYCSQRRYINKLHRDLLYPEHDAIAAYECCIFYLDDKAFSSKFQSSNWITFSALSP